MKRLSMAMTALAVMGLMTMVSCRKPNVGNVPGEARTITFNATTESGNGSKTYLDGLDVKWSENDVIYVNGTETGNQLKLASEPGSTFGSFSSQNFTAESPYMVGYPEPTAISSSQITFTIPAVQNIYNNGSGYDLTGVLPMAAYTADENGDLSFKNMVNVLKLNLTGTQSLTKIEVESTENLSGTFNVGTDIKPSAIASGTNKITITKNMTLNSDPQTVYVVLPVFGNAESTVTIKFTGTAGVMTVGPKALTGSNTPNHRYSASVNVLLETPWSASVVTIPVCVVHATCASSGGKVTSGSGIEEQGVIWAKASQLGSNDLTVANCTTYGGGKYVHQYEYATGSLTPKNTTTNNTFTGFMSGLSANTEYYVRAYIKKGNQVVYGDDETFTTLSTEPAVTGVDLGLPSGRIWATCNLGATTPEGYGDYYMWGDNAACTGTTSGKTVDCGSQSYRYAANSTTTFTKYCPSGKTDYWYNYSQGTNEPDGKESLGAAGDHYNYADDCVRQTLGGDWRMPTTAEWKELYDNTTRTWTTSGGVNGWRFTGEGSYTGVSLFLPAAGYRNGTSLYYAGSVGYYWSSSLYSSNPISAYVMYFDSGGVLSQYYYYRYGGFSVRPVR